MENRPTNVKLPEWKELYEKFGDAPYDSILTYEELNQVLPSGDVRTNKRTVLYVFKREMLRQKLKLLENVQKKGYRIVKPNEHIRLSNREVKRAERRARVAVDIIAHTDMNKLTDRERAIASLAATRTMNLLANIVGDQKALKEIPKMPELPRLSKKEE